MNQIQTNKELELLIYSIRALYGNVPFNSDKQIDAYFKASILIFENLKKPFWKGAKKREVKYSDYIQTHMNVIFENDISKAIEQLCVLRKNKDIISIEFNFRGLEFLIRNHSYEFNNDAKEAIVDSLKPFINRFNS